MTGTDVPWRRRPRKPLNAVPLGFLLWPLAFFWLLVAIVVGLVEAFSATDPRWARGLGGLACALALLLLAVAVTYLRRPVGAWPVEPGVDRSIVDEWTSQLRAGGVVEVGLNARAVATRFTTITAVMAVLCVMVSGVTGVIGMVLAFVGLLMLGSLAVVPHLEFVTGGRPALRVDSAGVQMARWGSRLNVPWSAIERVAPYRSTSRQVNTVIYVAPEFFRADLGQRNAILRWVEGPFRSFLSNGYVIPDTADAEPGTLADWLQATLNERR